MSTQPPSMKINFDNVPCFHVSGFFGGVNPNEGNISFYYDTLIPTQGNQPGQIKLGTIEHTFVTTIKMSPIVWKRIALWMMDHVKQYESRFGEIQVVPEKQTPDRPSYYG